MNPIKGSSVVNALTLAAILFLLYLAWAERENLMHWINLLHAGWFFVASLMLVASNVVGALIFSFLIGDNADASRFRQRVAAAYLLGQVSKYLPGRIWGVVQQTFVMKGQITPGLLVLANFEWFGLTLLLTSGAGLALFTAMNDHLLLATLIALTTIFCCSLLFRAGITRKFWNRIASRFGLTSGTVKHRDMPQVSSSANRSVWCYWGFAAFLLLFGSGWIVFFSCALSLGQDAAIELTTILALSAVVGMLSLLPGGLGAREVSMIFMGGLIVENPAALPALAVATRMAIIVIDILSSAVGAFMLVKGGQGVQSRA